jgi:hypothetical protein|nr:MAG TPA: hypothetical protein [Caudoviricetes sp.]
MVEEPETTDFEDYETTDFEDYETTDDDVVLEDMPVFDTSKALRRKRVEIDGTVYTIRPVGTKDYYNIIKQRNRIQYLNDKLGSDPKSLIQASKMMDDMIVPLISPNDDFKAWARATKSKSEYVYRQVMDQLIKLAMQGVEVKNG